MKEYIDKLEELKKAKEIVKDMKTVSYFSRISGESPRDTCYFELKAGNINFYSEIGQGSFTQYKSDRLTKDFSEIITLFLHSRKNELLHYMEEYYNERLVRGLGDIKKESEKLNKLISELEEFEKSKKEIEGEN